VAAVLGAGGAGASAAFGGADRASAPVLRVVAGGVPLPLPFSARSSAPPSPAAPAAHRAVTAHRLPDFAVRVTGRVAWIRVTTASGRELYAGMLRHGSQLAYNSSHLVVTVGNAGAVRLVLHHHLQPHVAGRPGQVLRLDYRRSPGHHR
jgi:Domain of unknown function (DUF4115)